MWLGKVGIGWVRSDVKRSFRNILVRTFLVRTFLVRTFLVRTFLVRTFLVRTFLVRTFLVRTFLVRTFLVRTFLVRTFLLAPMRSEGWVVSFFLVAAATNNERFKSFFSRSTPSHCTFRDEIETPTQSLTLTHT